MKQILVLTSLLLATLPTLRLISIARADDAAPKADGSDTLRCERFKMESVGDLKEKLLMYCNLDKPYSFSASDPLGGNPMATYCCRKKGT